MASSHTNLIVHPVRLRLLVALARRQLTARQLGELLPDVPPATLYHHLGKLTRGGVLRVVSERPIRGAVEKLYALADDSATLSPDEMAHASREDHLRYFTVFVAMLLSEFARYLQQEAPIDLLADGVGYRETPFYLSDEEFAQAAAALNQALLPFLSYQPTPNRRRRLFTTVVIPDTDPTNSRDDSGPSSGDPSEE
ncbi:MAG: helix-turn-helix domain-containing protein [Ktedonobacterales bacterium]